MDLLEPILQLDFDGKPSITVCRLASLPTNEIADAEARWENQTRFTALILSLLFFGATLCLT